MSYINYHKNLSTAETFAHNLLDWKFLVDSHRCNKAATFGLFVNEDHSELLMLYWLPKHHKRSS